MSELETLVEQTPDVIGFLRSQIGVKVQPPADREGSVSGKPKSTPPLNVDALDAADLELATLAHWGGVCGVPWQGRVRWAGGRVQGVLYDDARPAESLVAGFKHLFRSGWTPPEGMLESFQEVRYRHQSVFSGLDALFGKSVDEERPEEPGLFDMEGLSA